MNSHQFAADAAVPLPHHRARRRLLTAAALAAAGAGRNVMAQEGRRIALVVGFPAGGATDVLARLIADGMRTQLGATVVVENRPGAGGRIAAEYVKSAKNDGSVLLFTISSVMVIHPHIYQKLPFDPMGDFTPVGIAARSTLCLSVGPAVPDTVRSLADYVAWVKANPAMATFGTVSGTAPHFAGLVFSRAAGLNLRLAAYKGGAPAITDLIGGHLPATVTPVSEAQPYQAAGRIRILASMGPRRPKVLPDTPTMIELGYPDVNFQAWIGIFAPANLAPSTTAQLNGALARLMKTDDVLSGISKLGMEPEPVTPEAFAAILRAEHEQFRKSVAITGFKAED
jgi:tripartite-type tricarboxylate transporter receptor subunit TctC